MPFSEPRSVWIDIVHAPAPELPALLSGGVIDTTRADPADWAVPAGEPDEEIVEAFIRWRRQFMHTLLLGTIVSLSELADRVCYTHAGRPVRLDKRCSLDQAAATAVWQRALTRVGEDDPLRPLVYRLGSAAALARSSHSSLRLRPRNQRWPVALP